MSTGRRELGDLVVILPGITGSVLEKDGREVWAPTWSVVGAALWSGGGSVEALRLGEDPPDVDDLGDGVRATRLVDDAHLVPGLVKIDGYTRVLKALEESFDV